MLIIEGSDCLGKTTAANKIVELCAIRAKDIMESKRPEYAYPVRYEHMDRPNVAFDFFQDYCEMINRYGVMDRFHLGALVWHKDVMQYNILRRIEGWLAVVGSFTVIFYAADEGWYQQWLETHAEHEELFDIDVLMKANCDYHKMIKHKFRHPVHFDMAFDISDQFPGDKHLETIIDGWFNKLEAIER